MKSRIVCLAVCAAFALTGCSSPSGSSDPLGIGGSMDESIQEAETNIMIGTVLVGAVTYSLIHQHRAHVRAMRPMLTLSAPERAAPNAPIQVESAYRDKGKVVPDWWASNPYTVTIRREGNIVEAPPALTERRENGTLFVTFQPAEPGAWEIEVRTWASGADTASEKPRAAARRSVKVR